MIRNRKIAAAQALVAAGAAVALLVLPVVAHAEPRTVDPVAARVVALTNDERARQGLPALALNENLTNVAQDYAQVLATSGCFAHECGPVPDLRQRIERGGYRGAAAFGENLANGHATPEGVVTAWLNSAGHRTNVLSKTYTEIGVGIARGGSKGVYWSQEFGSRAPAAPPPSAARLPLVSGTPFNPDQPPVARTLSDSPPLEDARPESDGGAPASDSAPAGSDEAPG